MTHEELLAHCEKKADEYWAKYHETKERENALVISGMASAFDEMVGFLKNGY